MRGYPEKTSISKDLGHAAERPADASGRGKIKDLGKNRKAFMRKSGSGTF
jgi:hypothetical protein